MIRGTALDTGAAMNPDAGGTSDSTGRNVDGTFGDGQQGFASETSAAAGMTKQAINRHLARADALGDDLDAVVGTSLDKGVEMDALAKMPEEDRRELIDRAQAGELVSARQPERPDASGMVSTLIDDMHRIAQKFSPEDVAEAVASRALNPGLYPYVEAVFNGNRSPRTPPQRGLGGDASG